MEKVVLNESMSAKMASRVSYLVYYRGTQREYSSKPLNIELLNVF